MQGEALITGPAHLGYGASCGAVFALLTRRRPTADLQLGVGYGLVLWLAGYGLWVPAIGALPPLHRDRPDRQLALVAGHVVYGAVLSEGLRCLRSHVPRRSSIEVGSAGKHGVGR